MHNLAIKSLVAKLVSTNIVTNGLAAELCLLVTRFDSHYLALDLAIQLLLSY